MRRRTRLVFGFLLMLIACQEVPAPCEPPLSLQARADLTLGVAVQAAAFRLETSYSGECVKNFGRITPENALKMERLQPEQGVFAFAEADSLVDAALRRGLQVHGHTLIWHNQLPNWIDSFNGDREAWLILMERHICTVMEHFAGRITSWDVVNEALDERGNLRDSPWREGIGDDYVEQAFRIASRADSSARLFYNDYNLWRKPAKCKAALEILEGLQEQGWVHGVGFQGHIDIRGPGEGSIRSALEAAAGQKLFVHISELDVSLNPAGKENINLANLFDKQALAYRKVVAAYREAVDPTLRFGITVWGLNDQYSWIPAFFQREDAPLLWDAAGRPKPALCGFLEGLE